ncbi:hypothetical protein LIER_35063 [Lithospermum erythrorhizon]|uniref:Uncharacterized protein n=1 Tax=Lithospermum erythrorhizon TaxID=34254 RepID=A0AAV3NNF3_LITER
MADEGDDTPPGHVFINQQGYNNRGCYTLPYLDRDNPDNPLPRLRRRRRPCELNFAVFMTGWLYSWSKNLLPQVFDQYGYGT